MNQLFFICFFNCFDRLSFQNQFGMKELPFYLTKLITVLTGVFIYQPNKYAGNTRFSPQNQDVLRKKNILIITIAGLW